MRVVLLAVVMFFTTTAFGDQYIGGGNAGISHATIRAVRVFHGGGAYFWINESSGSVPWGRAWRFTHTTPAGASVLSAVIAAKAAGLPVVFKETSFITTGEYNFDNFTIGE